MSDSKMSDDNTSDERLGIFQQILTSRVYEVVSETDLDDAKKLSRKLGNHVQLKREDSLAVHSFKLRGAYNCVAHLDEASQRGGVIAASAGNHAQGVAYSARHLGISARIVMPRTTPEIKLEAVRELGADVVLFGNNFADAKAHCAELCAEGHETFVDAYDDPLVIAGQGGLTEPDPREDLGGRDVARKLVMLGRMAADGRLAFHAPMRRAVRQ